MMLPTFTLPLPGVGTPADCSNWNLTVEPFIPQLYELPGKFIQNASSLESLKQLYISTNPLIMGFAISLALAPVFLVISEINKNYSQVDRVWSILPSMLACHHLIPHQLMLSSHVHCSFQPMGPSCRPANSSSQPPPDIRHCLEHTTYL
jgi:hypothetical protein